MGRKSKDKPEAFLDQARKVYNDINAELEEIKRDAGRQVAPCV